MTVPCSVDGLGLGTLLGACLLLCDILMQSNTPVFLLLSAHSRVLLFNFLKLLRRTIQHYCKLHIVTLPSFFTAAALNRLQLGIFNANCACCMYMFVKGAQMTSSVLPLYDIDVVGG